MNSDNLIQKLYEATVKNMLDNYDNYTMIMLRKQNPGLSDEQIKEKVRIRGEELKQKKLELLDKYNRLIKQDSTDMITREILKLHNPQGTHYLDCQGCDYGGYEAESPGWPCRTIDIIFSNME